MARERSDRDTGSLAIQGYLGYIPNMKLFSKICRHFMRRRIHAKRCVRLSQEIHALKKEEQLLRKELEIKESVLSRYPQEPD